MQEIAKGNTAALELFYAQSATPIFNSLRARFGSILDPGEIDAVVATTVYRVWQKGGTFTGETDKMAQGWILSIARHLALDLIRVKQKAKEIETEIDDERLNALSDPAVFDESGPDLQKFMQRLTEKEREVAEHLALGERDSQIAQQMKISRTRVHQIKAQIAKKAAAFYPK